MKNPREVADAHYAACDRGDLPGMLSHLAADIVWTEAAGFPLGGTYIGLASVRDHLFRAFSRDWDEWTVAIDELVVDGETVVGLGTRTATHKTTGKALAARVAHVWRVREGEAVSFEEIADTAEVIGAMS